MKTLLFLGLLFLIFWNRCFGANCNGAYLHPGGGVLTIAPFDLGDGEQHFVFVDFRDGYIRILKQDADQFVAGPTLFSDSPIELRVGCTEQELHFAINGKADRATRMEIREESVRFPSGEINLAGTLYLPKQAPSATIVLLHGSGPLNRYSFGPIPYFFAASGFAVLVYDKRGTGQSTGAFDTATFDQLADDGAAAVAFLNTRKEIDTKRIGLWGSSQGGFLTAAVAAKGSGLYFLIDHSGMYVPAWQQEIYRTKAEMAAEGYSTKEISMALDYLDLFFEVAKTGQDWEKLQARNSELKNEKWFDLIPRADSLEALQLYWKNQFNYDPTKNLEKVSCPVLAVFGELDRSSPVQESIENIKRGLPKSSKFDYRIFSGANHGMLKAKTGSDRETPELTHLVIEAFDYERDWIRKLN